MNAERIRQIGTGLLLVPSYNPRTEDLKKIDELAESIKALGLLQPLLVVENEAKAGKYDVVDGGRRLRALEKLGIPTATCVVAASKKQEDLELAALAANTQRKQLSPMDEARAIEAFRKKHPGASLETVAASLGMKKETVRVRGQLLKLEPTVTGKLASGEITLVQAEQLARLQPNDQKEMVRNTGRWESLRDLRRRIDERYFLKLDKAPFSLKDPKLFPQAGACAMCPKATDRDRDLFSDIGPGRCTDGACFRQKLRNFAEASFNRVKAADPKVKVLKISTNYYPDQAGLIGRGAYRESVERGCKHTVGAVVFEDDNPKNIGKAAFVCVERSCKVHQPGGISSGGRSGPSRAALALAQLKGEVAASLVFRAAVERSVVLEKKMILALVFRFWDYIGHDAQRRVAQTIGLKKSAGLYGDWDRSFRLLARKLPAGRLAALLLAVAAAQDLVIHQYSTKMERLGKDLVGIRKLLKIRKTEEHHAALGYAPAANLKKRLEKRKTKRGMKRAKKGGKR